MNQMNWFQTELTIHEQASRAEKAARSYPHIAHLLEQKSTRRRINEALVAFGRLLVVLGNTLQRCWAFDIPDCPGTPLANNEQ